MDLFFSLYSSDHILGFLLIVFASELWITDQDSRIKPMIGANRQLVTNEPVECEN